MDVDPATCSPGLIVLLNGAPRAGKSSIATALQAADDRPWRIDGVDAVMATTPDDEYPGIGLRPGGERPDLEPIVAREYRRLFRAAAHHAALGRHTVMDVGIHDGHSQDLGLWSAASEAMDPSGTYLVGVRCSLDTILARRSAAPTRNRTRYETIGQDHTAPGPVRRWQEAVHRPGLYDVEVDTTVESAARCAAVILYHLATTPPQALAELARRT